MDDLDMISELLDTAMGHLTKLVSRAGEDPAFREVIVQIQSEVRMALAILRFQKRRWRKGSTFDWSPLLFILERIEEVVESLITSL